ncbi:MAG TPA: thiamine phosphate synthase [Pyrinomonadaceae bacterium]|nr:thiamine phosphate synthase [Pyrinomonadaceae bacterium]
MDLNLPKIYPITNSEVSGLSHTEQVRRLIAGGATFIQLREKQKAAGDWFPDALEAARLCREAGVTCIVNDRVDIALTIDADGVHLGQDDMPVAYARRLLGRGKIIGLSTHSIEQLEAALREPVDYLAIGPIFDTSTKSDPDPAIGIEMLSKAAQTSGMMPLVAIGGIKADNLSSIISAGAASAAIIGALLADPDRISERFHEYSQIASQC